MRHPDDLLETVRPHLAVLARTSSSKPLKLLLHKNKEKSLRRQRAIEALKPAYEEIMEWAEDQLKKTTHTSSEQQSKNQREKCSSYLKVEENYVRNQRRCIGGTIFKAETMLLIENLKFRGIEIFSEKTEHSTENYRENGKIRTTFENLDFSLDYDKQLFQQAQTYQKILSGNFRDIIGFPEKNIQQILNLPWDFSDNQGEDVDQDKLIRLELGLFRLLHEEIRPSLVKNVDDFFSVTKEMIEKKLALVDEIPDISHEARELVRTWMKEDLIYLLPGILEFPDPELDCAPQAKRKPNTA